MCASSARVALTPDTPLPRIRVSSPIAGARLSAPLAPNPGGVRLRASSPLHICILRIYHFQYTASSHPRLFASSPPRPLG
jgi:hypothetical protein